MARHCFLRKERNPTASLFMRGVVDNFETLFLFPFEFREYGVVAVVVDRRGRKPVAGREGEKEERG